LWLIDGGEFHEERQFVCQTTRCVSDICRMLFAVAKRQLPRRFGDGAVTVFALNFNLRQCGARQIAVAMHINGRMAILAQHSAFGVARATLCLVMQIIFDEQVILGVQFRLLAAASVYRLPYGNSMMP